MHKLFVFEGPDAVGKTTLANSVKNILIAEGIRSEYLSFPGRDHGSLGAHIYAIHHSPKDFGINCMTPASVQTLHIAAHLDAIERRILPSLHAGTLILLDRYWWSTLAYGAAEGIGTEFLNMLRDIELHAWKGIKPTNLFLLERKSTKTAIALTKNYESLVSQEEGKYPITRISNNTTLQDAAASVSMAIRAQILESFTD